MHIVQLKNILKPICAHIHTLRTRTHMETLAFGVYLAGKCRGYDRTPHAR